MKVQKVLDADQNLTWVLLDDDFLLVEPVQDFLDYLRNVERSPNTVKSYAYHLKLYWEFLRSHRLDWKIVSLTQLADFVAWLRSPQGDVISLQEQEAKRKESTVNAIITSVCMFYDFQERAGSVKNVNLYTERMQPGRRYKSFLHHINKGKPVQHKLIKLKEPKRFPKTLTQEQVQQLIDACHTIRDRFLICLLYESGMRIGQALGLRHEDIHSWDNVVKIVPRDDNINQARTKTRDSYSINVSKGLMELYTDYVLQEFGDVGGDYVFVNLWDGEIGQPMRYGAVADLFRRLSKKTGFRATPHMLRHTHATELIREGKWDVAYVQRRLGHANVQTTLNTYTHLTDEDLKQAYEEYVDEHGTFTHSPKLDQAEQSGCKT